MVERRRHLSIGRFAGLTGISANTLRKYDEMGLLSPACTDPVTRYRLYAVEQLDVGVLIRLLRDLDVPLERISALITAPSSQVVTTMLIRHRERVVGRRAELERIITRIDAILDEGRGLLPYELEIVTLQPVWVMSRRSVTTRARLDDTIERCLGELADQLAAGEACATGREIVLYHNPLQWYVGLELEVCLPVEQEVAASAGGWELDGGTAVRTIYRGPWDDTWQAYSILLAELARGGHEIRGPVRESYLVDERDTDDPQRYVTEITWPVRVPTTPTE